MKYSAGLLLYRPAKDSMEVLLVHPGGPFWTRKDSWGIPKGQFEEGEEPLAAAKREFSEELGLPLPDGEFIELGEIKVNNKTIVAWALQTDIDVSNFRSNTNPLEWPPRSGIMIEVPEIDKAAWIDVKKAITKMHKGQDEFVRRLAQHIGYNLDKPEPTQSSLF